MCEIEFAGVSKRYADGFEAVKPLDLPIADGEFLALVGPSGCGKTTALRMIAGLEEITDGELRIDGERVNELAPKDRDVAMVFQSYALYPHMSVRENMGFSLRLAGVARDDIRRRVVQTARMLDLEPHLDRRPAKLSGGQRQRVAMGRAIVREPKAFLMDEPLSNLDAKLRVQMRFEVARLQRRLGTTTVYVTHDQTEAMTLGQRVAVMLNGELQQVDSPAELYESPANLFVAGFIGSPAMNFFRGELATESVRTAFGEIPLRGDMRQVCTGGGVDRHVVVGIRPEELIDARLVSAEDQGGRLSFDVAVELTEVLGPDSYAYFTLASPVVERIDFGSLISGGGSGGGTSQFIARLDARSGVRSGERLTLSLDPRCIHLFASADGGSLLTPPRARGSNVSTLPGVDQIGQKLIPH